MPSVPWNPETARLAGLKSVEVRRRNKLEREAQAEIARTNPQFARPINAVPLPELTYADRRLARVREQLDRIDSMIEGAEDSKTIKELTDAQMRLAEQERILAGRPLPGSLKPQAARRSRQQQNLGPVEPESE